MCCSFCLFLCLLCFTCLYFLLFRNGKNIFTVSPPWFDRTISCHDNLTLSYAGFFHFLARTKWPRSISYTANGALCHTSFIFSVSYNLPPILNFPAQSSLGRKISVCSGQCSYFFSSWGEFTCTLQDEWLQRSHWEMAVKQYDPLLSSKQLNGQAKKCEWEVWKGQPLKVIAVVFTREKENNLQRSCLQHTMRATYQIAQAEVTRVQSPGMN